MRQLAEESERQLQRQIRDLQQEVVDRERALERQRGRPAVETDEMEEQLKRLKSSQDVMRDPVSRTVSAVSDSVGPRKCDNRWNLIYNQSSCLA